MDGDIRLWPLFDAARGDMLIHPFYPQTPTPHYLTLDQMADYIGAGTPGPPGPQGPQGPSGSTTADYSLVVPTTGQTLSVPSIAKYILNPAGALATLTLNLPVVSDKQAVRIATRQRIDALTIAASGATVDWLGGELPQYGMIDLTYVSSLTAWVRA